MLNWRRDPDYARRMNVLRSDTAQIRSDFERIKNETEQIRNEAEQIKKEAEQLREQNARGRQLLASMHALCLADDSSSIPAPPTAAATAPSSP
jgi:predicted  nucleic acid-binding Zn-ribbon protein